MQRFAAALAISVITFGTSALAASLDDVDPHMRKDAECMYGVLKNVPGIDQVKLGVWVDHRQTPHVAVPYLEYRAVADKDGYRQIVRFGAETSRTADGKESYYFMTVLSGLIGAGERAPRDGGASRVADRWKAECHVEATILFE